MLRNMEQGSHVRICRSCNEKDAAWVLKDQNPGYRKCPFSDDRWEYLPDVVGSNWKEPYRTMIVTVGPSSLPEKRLEVASVTREVYTPEHETVMEVTAH